MSPWGSLRDSGQASKKAYLCMRVQIDASGWPVVVVTTPRHVMEPQEHSDYLDQLTSFHTRGEMFGFIFDVRLSPPPPAEQRRQLAERMDRDVKRFGRRAPCALVVANGIQSGVVKVIQWLLREPHPVQVFTSVDAARHWLEMTWSIKASKSSRPPE